MASDLGPSKPITFGPFLAPFMTLAGYFVYALTEYFATWTSTLPKLSPYTVKTP